ncbi:signal peptide peptidase SppA [Desulfurobacterium sp.]
MRKFQKFLTMLGAVFLLIMFFSLMRFLFSGNVPSGKGIAILKINGVITDTDYYIKELEKLSKNNDVKAIVLRVDSPGGAVVPCQELYDEILRVKKKKPVVVSMGSVAASGGLYISVAANKIVADPATITGSIGVIMQTMNFRKIADKIGVKVVTIKSGPHKDLLNPFKKVDPGDVAIVQNVINDTYHQFLEAVSKGRHIPIDKLKPIADGRIFSGREAQKLGLVDELGDLHKAVSVARELAHSPDAKPFEVKKEQPFIDKILGGQASVFFDRISSILKGEIEKKNLMYLY